MTAPGRRRQGALGSSQTFGGKVRRGLCGGKREGQRERGRKRETSNLWLPGSSTRLQQKKDTVEGKEVRRLKGNQPSPHVFIDFLSQGGSNTHLASWTAGVLSDSA